MTASASQAELGSGATLRPGNEPFVLGAQHEAQPTHKARLTRQRSLRERILEWRELATSRFGTLDLTPDLAEEIGSKRWWRGAGTLVGLSALALAFWPDFSPAEAAPATRVDDRVHDEFRSQMIMPLALGADSGRRMSATSLVQPLKTAPERPQIQLVATLAQGDSFARMLQRAGVGADDADRVATLVSRAVPVDEIADGTRFDITLGRRPSAGQPRALESVNFRARFDLNLALERRGGQLILDPRPIQVDSTPLRIRGQVGNSLYRSARAAGAPAGAVQEYLRTLGKQVNLDSIAASDTFDLVLDYKRAETGEAEPGKLLYAGLERGENPRAQLLRWGKDGQFYEASGVGEQRGGSVAPVPGRVTSGFGMRRHPILGYRRMHSGWDFKAGHGTPIVAVTDGKVAGAGRMGGCGIAVKLSHGNGLSTRYCHMSRLAVRGGQSVRAGQVIGYVGSTGLSTGAHLHYEVYRGGRAVNPGTIRFVTRAQLEGAELQAFRNKLSQLKTIEPGSALVDLKPRSVDPVEPVREIDRVDNPGNIASFARPGFSRQ